MRLRVWVWEGAYLAGWLAGWLGPVRGLPSIAHPACCKTRALQVDIIISEWMGYFLVYESMLDSVLYARDK